MLFRLFLLLLIAGPALAASSDDLCDSANSFAPAKVIKPFSKTYQSLVAHPKYAPTAYGDLKLASDFASSSEGLRSNYCLLKQKLSKQIAPTEKYEANDQCQPQLDSQASSEKAIAAFQLLSDQMADAMKSTVDNHNKMVKQVQAAQLSSQMQAEGKDPAALKGEVAYLFSDKPQAGTPTLPLLVAQSFKKENSELVNACGKYEQTRAQAAQRAKSYGCAVNANAAPPLECPKANGAQ